MPTVVDELPRSARPAEPSPARNPAPSEDGRPPDGQSNPTPALLAALLGFFVITLDAVIVNIALPSIRSDLGASMSGLQWVVNGYTLMFAALLLSAGALSDRIGARRAFAVGLGIYVAGSIASGLTPALGSLIATRFIQGVGAAVMMPSTMALIPARQRQSSPWAD